MGNYKHTYWDMAGTLRSGATTLAFLLLSFHPLFAQGKLLPVFDFRRLTTADGLPTNQVWTNVVRDRRGFVWVGTENGLVRYDAYTCKVYRSFSSPENAIVLHLDSRGRLWIGTYSSGLSLYDPINDRFVNFLHRQNDSTSLRLKYIGTIHEDGSGVLWLTSGESQVVQLDLGPAREETNADSVARHARFHTLTPEMFRDGVSQVAAWDGTNLVVGTAIGLFLINRETFTISRPHIPVATGLNLDTVAIIRLFRESPQRLWIGTLLHGLYLLDQGNGSLTAYHKRSAAGTRTKDAHILDLQMDGSGRLWIATGDGVDLFDPVSGKYIDYLPFERAPGKSMWTRMSSDITGTLWISTGNEGLYFLPSRSLLFPRYGLQGSSGGPMEMETINGWTDGSYWIGAEGKVARVQLESMRVLQTVDLFRGRRTAYGPTGVWASYDDGKGSLWYGAWGLGLFQFEPQRDRVTNFRFSSQLTHLLNREDVCLSILGVGSDSLWIAAYLDKLLCFNTRSNMFSQVPRTSVEKAFQLMKDSSGKIWVSDEWGGLFVYDPSTSGWEHFEHNPSDPSSISRATPQNTFQDPRGRIWVGCDTLDLWEPETRSFKHFPNPAFGNATFGKPIGSDRRGRVWVQYQDKGVAILDPAGGQFTNFDHSDGVVTPITMASLQDGRVAIVGYGGMNIVDPESVFISQPPPPLVIAKILVNDTSDIPLQRITPGSTLRLPYDQNVLEFEFAAIDPGATHLIDYLFRLEGLEKSWVHPGGRRFVRYPGLSPGEYVFRVKAINRFGRWPDQEITLAVSIAPPWWRTWWAYGAYGLLLISLLYSGYHTRLRQLHLKQQAEMEHFQAQHLAEVDRLKSRFFANISHEFRTPLTLILGPADQLTEVTTEASSRQKLSLITDNAKKLFALVNQLLDFSRLESGMMRLQVSRGDIVQFFRRVVMSFESWAERKQIGLEFRSDAESIHGYFDADKFEKIVNNLMSNALKFTPEGGAVSVRVTQCRMENSEVRIRNSGRDERNAGVRIAVSDTGPGISADHLPHIFDRFYRVDETHTTEGTGIGLALTKELVDLHHGTITVESTPGKGLVFTVSFPIGQSAYAGIEIAESAPEMEKREDVEAETSPEEPKPIPTAAPADGKPIVLVVEDNADLRTYIREYLEADYAVQEAGNGKEGYDRATEIVPDLVISDIMMPEMDGMELCRALKLDVRTSHVPVILLTARAGTDSKIEGLEIGADDYVTKPFETKELGARVRNLIEQRRLLRKKFSAGVVLKPGEVTVASLDDAFLQEAISVVEKRMSDENFAVEELAVEIGMSRVQLHRKLTALTGQSSSEFIRSLRLHRGMELLKKNAGTVSEIAYMVGFGKPSNFAKWFQEQFGVLPSSIRKDVIDQNESGRI